MKQIAQWKRRVPAFLLAAVCVLFSATEPASAVSQADIAAVREERDAVTAQKKEQQATLDELTATQSSVIDEKLALEEHMSLTNEQISLNDQEIALYDEMIAEKQQEVEAARQLEEDQLQKYRARVRAMEENGELTLMVLLSESQSLADLLTAIDDAGDIMASDRKLEDEYIAARKAYEAVQAEYEKYRKELLATRDVLQAERDQLTLENEQAQQRLDELDAQISESSDLIAELEARWDELNSQLSELQSEYDAQQAAASSVCASAAPGSLTGAGFIWPCGSYYITSRAGTRVHPLTGQTSNHSGTDIGLGEGEPIWAAASGTVTLADWNGGYGNCVMIDHGGYTTLYGHMSSLAVSAGQGVSAGQVIGYCGSTGWATGPHLHFEIRSGGGCVDPEAFFPSGSFSYAPDAGE